MKNLFGKKNYLPSIDSVHAEIIQTTETKFKEFKLLAVELNSKRKKKRWCGNKDEYVANKRGLLSIVFTFSGDIITQKEIWTPKPDFDDKHDKVPNYDYFYDGLSCPLYTEVEIINQWTCRHTQEKDVHGQVLHEVCNDTKKYKVIEKFKKVK